MDMKGLSVRSPFVLQAREDVGDLTLSRHGIANPIRRQQRQMKFARQADCSLIARLLKAIAMSLQFDVHVLVRKNRDEPLE